LPLRSPLLKGENRVEEPPVSRPSTATPELPVVPVLPPTELAEENVFPPSQKGGISHASSSPQLSPGHAGNDLTEGESMPCQDAVASPTQGSHLLPGFLCTAHHVGADVRWGKGASSRHRKEGLPEPGAPRAFDSPARPKAGPVLRECTSPPLDPRQVG